MRLLLLLLVVIVSGCKPITRNEPVTMVMGSWYGFYPFYFAVENGIDKKYGIRLKIVEPTNIADFRRGYLRSQVDISATSMVEYTNASQMSNHELRPIIITDYSNGGDNIVALKSITNTEQLKGKRIAVPSKGIAEYLMAVVLNDQTPTDQFIQIPIPENECSQAFKSNQIEACVTYPPMSNYLIDNPKLHILYSSKEHPQRIFDLVWAKPHVTDETVKKLQLIWFDVVNLIKREPDAFNEFVARISNVSVTSVRESMEGIELIDMQRLEELRSVGQRLSDDLVVACVIARNDNCERFGQRLWDNL